MDIAGVGLQERGCQREAVSIAADAVYVGERRTQVRHHTQVLASIRQQRRCLVAQAGCDLIDVHGRHLQDVFQNRFEAGEAAPAVFTVYLGVAQL